MVLLRVVIWRVVGVAVLLSLAPVMLRVVIWLVLFVGVAVLLLLVALLLLLLLFIVFSYSLELLPFLLIPIPYPTPRATISSSVSPSHHFCFAKMAFIQGMSFAPGATSKPFLQPHTGSPPAWRPVVVHP